MEKIRLKNLYRSLRAKYPSVMDEDFKYIFARVFGSFSKIFLENPAVDKSEAKKIETIIHKHLEGRPLEYIFEVAEFFGFEFKIKEGIHMEGLKPTPRLNDNSIGIWSNFSEGVSINLCKFHFNLSSNRIAIWA